VRPGPPIRPHTPTVSYLIPFFRVADAEASAAWYARLGFRELSRHRFAAGPLWIGLARDDVELFLSEHLGDAPPASLAYLRVEDIAPIASALGMEPEATDYDLLELEVTDLDGYRIRIGAPAEQAP
jgi:catechol 2,3-dioxygenase-like lactoylglutathione lyase family enzyme